MDWELRGGRLLGAPAEIMAGLLELPGVASPNSSEGARSGRATQKREGSTGSHRWASVTIDRLPSGEAFDYMLDGDLRAEARIGSIVRVPLGARSVRGWITGFPERPGADDAKLRPVKAVLGGMPVFGVTDLVAARLVARYYMAGLWQVLRHFQPPGLPPRVHVAASGAHADASGAHVEDARLRRPEVTLLQQAPANPPIDEIVGAAMECVNDGRSAIVVVPGPLPDLAAAFARRDLRVIDLTRSDGATRRRASWTRAATRGAVVIGGRSAVFQPVPNLGLMAVLDECNPALKEQSSPCYHAREAAVFRSAAAGAKVMIAGSTASSEARAWATNVVSPSRDVMRSSWPGVEFLYRYDEAPGSGVLGEAAVARIRRVLQRGGRVLVFLNRVGEARAVRCAACSRLRICAKCGGALLPERGAATGGDKLLICGECVLVHSLACEHCRSTSIRRLGAGTPALLREAGTLFPGVSIARADRDTDEPASDARLIVGTEAAFWRVGRVDMVVVADLDSLILAPDALAEESVFRLMARAAALVPPRSMGNPNPGLVVQTYTHSPAIETPLTEGNSEKMQVAILEERSRLALPPFARAARISLTGPDAATWADRLAEGAVSQGARVLGPDSIDGRARVLVLSDSPMHHWPEIAAIAARARAGGCRVRNEVDPLRLG